MIERGKDLRLALESRHALAILRECFGQNLQRHVAIELGVARAPHLSHPARPERR